MQSKTEKKEVTGVAFCVDEKFIPHLGVALVSLFLSNDNRKIDVFVATHAISIDAKSRLDGIAQKFGRELTYLNIDLSKIDHLRQYFQPTSAYYRLLLPLLLPDRNRVIYLDCDLVVEMDLSNLWEIDIDAYGCAAFPEPEYHQQWMVKKYGIEGDLYVNSGVLLMNLAYWRKNLITEQCIHWLQENEELAVMMDQDAINKILFKKKLFIDRKWNLNPIHGPVQALLDANPERIIHFAGGVKPWHKWYDFSLSRIYFKYLDLTPWRGDVAIEEPRNTGQAVSVANQHFGGDNFILACRYYQRAIEFYLAEQQLENLLMLNVINIAHRLFNSNDYMNAADLYRACFGHWGYPVTHGDIYKIKGILGR